MIHPLTPFAAVGAERRRRLRASSSSSSSVECVSSFHCGMCFKLLPKARLEKNQRKGNSLSMCSTNSSSSNSRRHDSQCYGATLCTGSTSPCNTHWCYGVKLKCKLLQRSLPLLPC